MPEAIDDLQAKKHSDDFELWEENVQVVQMFLRMQTQWVVGMGGPVGMHYPSLEWLCKLYAVTDPAAMLEGIQVMEVAALAFFAENRK